MIKRTNAQWLADLVADNTVEQADALITLQERLQRGIYYYLSRDRSDLSSRSQYDLQQMAEDFAQEATLRVLKNLQSFRGDSQFTTWATKVAVRVAISELRRARYRDFSLEEITIDGEFMPNLNVQSRVNQPPGPEKATERSDVMRKIETALATSLTERQRVALEAVGIRGVPLDIVAEEMGTNRNALYKLLHDARVKLRAALEKEGLSMEYMKDLFE
ncbi:RNA polymerase sigma factor [Chloroflexota bacterium]